MHGGPRNNVAFTVVVSVLAVVGAAVMMVVIALSGAPKILLMATLLAVIPVGPLVFLYLWLDRYEPEPRTLLAAALVWGACVATGAAILLQGVGGFGLGLAEETITVWVAPVTEEFTKGFFLVLLLWWRRAELDGILDGIVYAGLIGVGFAFTENILYLAAAYNGTSGIGPGGTDELTGTFLVRCVMSPFAHPLFTTFIGIGIGFAVSTRSAALRWLAPLAGYLLAVAGHATWNASTTWETGGFFVMYLLLAFPAFIVMVAFALWMRTTERKVLESSLHDAATRGLLPATDIPWLVDLRARRQGRAWAKRHGGAEAARAMRDYQQAAIELGFLHHRYLRGTAPHDFAVRGQAHVARIQAARPHFQFPGQVVPTR